MKALRKLIAHPPLRAMLSELSDSYRGPRRHTNPRRHRGATCPPSRSPAALHLPRPQLLHRPARRVLTALVAGGVFVTGSGVAFADNVYNTLDPSIDATAEAMSLTAGGAAGTTQLKVDTTNEDGKNGCNLTGSTTLKLALRSSNTDLATVSPAEVIFTSCGDVKDLSVTGLKATGSTPVTISATQVSNDTGGRFDLAPVTFTVSVAAAAAAPAAAAGDTTAPDAPTIDLVAASDTGTSETDNYTNDTTPTLTGTAEAGSTVQVFDGETSLGTTTATSTGTWTFTPAALTGTSHSFTAKATDVATTCPRLQPFSP